MKFETIGNITKTGRDEVEPGWLGTNGWGDRIAFTVSLLLGGVEDITGAHLL